MKKKLQLDTRAGALNRCIVLETSGKGLWSSVTKTVAIHRLTWCRFSHDDDHQFWTVAAYFRKSEWDIMKHGLIYTDPRFIGQLRRALVDLRRRGLVADLPWGRLDYTEQGMQGGNYVSLEL